MQGSHRITLLLLKQECGKPILFSKWKVLYSSTKNWHFPQVRDEEDYTCLQYLETSTWLNASHLSRVTYMASLGHVNQVTFLALEWAEPIKLKSKVTRSCRPNLVYFKANGHGSNALPISSSNPFSFISPWRLPFGPNPLPNFFSSTSKIPSQSY